MTDRKYTIPSYRAGWRYELVPERPNVRFIDPPGCGCTDCLTGEAVPLDRASQDELQSMKEGSLGNRTGLVWVEVEVPDRGWR